MQFSRAQQVCWDAQPLLAFCTLLSAHVRHEHNSSHPSNPICRGAALATEYLEVQHFGPRPKPRAQMHCLHFARTRPCICSCALKGGAIKLPSPALCMDTTAQHAGQVPVFAPPGNVSAGWQQLMGASAVSQGGLLCSHSPEALLEPHSPTAASSGWDCSIGRSCDCKQRQCLGGRVIDSPCRASACCSRTASNGGDPRMPSPRAAELLSCIANALVLPNRRYREQGLKIHRSLPGAANKMLTACQISLNLLLTCCCCSAILPWNHGLASSDQTRQCKYWLRGCREGLSRPAL
jgi:hypothetical protein